MPVHVYHASSSRLLLLFVALSTQLLQKLKMSVRSEEQRQTAVTDLLQLHPLMNSAESSETSAGEIIFSKASGSAQSFAVIKKPFLDRKFL